ncbi:MAG: hypothetical protein ACI31M_01110 [Bacilli bacterium]
MVEFYKGKAITQDKIQKIKDIAYRRYSPEIFNEYFNSLNDIRDLSHLHGVGITMETLVIGTDWFLCYSESKYYVTILEWVSIDNRSKMQQAIEMMNVLKQILIQNKDKLFIADMRHDTSYTMYLKMLREGYFKEINHECIIDCAAPVQVHDIKAKYMKNFNSLKDFLASSDSNNYTKYFKYVLHHLSFVLTDKFVKKYDCTSSKPERKILKKEKQ